MHWWEYILPSDMHIYSSYGFNIPYSGFLMRSYIFMNYYLAGLYFGAIHSVGIYVSIKIHFDE